MHVLPPGICFLRLWRLLQGLPRGSGSRVLAALAMKDVRSSLLMLTM